MKKFQKKKEDFICQKCHAFVQGNGYTNHCPECLWSKHVDINPGDRNSKCEGMMKPIGIEIEGKNQYLIHECTSCKIRKRNKKSSNDNFEKILIISKNPLNKD